MTLPDADCDDQNRRSERLAGRVGVGVARLVALPGEPGLVVGQFGLLTGSGWGPVLWSVGLDRGSCGAEDVLAGGGVLVL
jgi:hypothetical protein